MYYFNVGKNIIIASFEMFIINVTSILLQKEKMISPEGKTNIKIRNFKRDRKWREQSIRRDGQSEIFSLTLIHKTTQVAEAAK